MNVCQRLAALDELLTVTKKHVDALREATLRQDEEGSAAAGVFGMLRVKLREIALATFHQN